MGRYKRKMRRKKMMNREKREIRSLEDTLEVFKAENEGKYEYEYMLSEGLVSKEWYEMIAMVVKKMGIKRVIDVGSNMNFFGYLFAREGIEYIGIDNWMDELKPVEGKNIKFIETNYYDVREEYKDEVIISCLCIGYLIPKEDVRAKLLITNGSGADNEIKITGKVE